MKSYIKPNDDRDYTDTIKFQKKKQKWKESGMSEKDIEKLINLYHNFDVCLWTFQNGKIYPDSSMIICFLRGQDLLGPIILRTATVLYLKHIHLLESMMKQYRSHV